MYSILSKHFTGNRGAGNGFSSLIMALIIGKFTNRCHISKITIYLVLDKHYFEKYYRFVDVIFCIQKNINKDTMEQIFLKQKRYSNYDFCKPALWEDNSTLIIYDTNYYKTCLVDHPNIKRKMKSTIMEIHKTFSENLILRDEYRKLLIKMFPNLAQKFIGGHIRTWGYFNDFKDFIGKERFNTLVSTFNTSRVIKAVDSLLNSNKLQFFLSSESIKLKEIIKNYVEKKGFHFLAYMNNVTHNKLLSIDTLGLDIIIDIEVLTNAEALLLSSGSSFSVTIGFKNKNCFKKKCIIIQACDRSIYERGYNKMK